MAEPSELNLFDMFGHKFPSRNERLRKAYADSEVHERSIQIMKSSEQERAGLEAQLAAYLAAGHTLFSEEMSIIFQSLKGPYEK